MTTGLKTIIYPVRDLDAAKSIFSTLLGSEPVMDQPYYVGYEAPGVHIGLDPNGHDHGIAGPVGYWHVEDIASAWDALVAAGAKEVSAVRDVGGGRRTGVLVDADGNKIGLLQEAG